MPAEHRPTYTDARASSTGTDCRAAQTDLHGRKGHEGLRYGPWAKELQGIVYLEPFKVSLRHKIVDIASGSLTALDKLVSKHDHLAFGST